MYQNHDSAVGNSADYQRLLAGLTNVLVQSYWGFFFWGGGGDGCWHPDSILTLTVFKSLQFVTLARPYIKYMLHSLQIFNHIN